MAFTAYTGDLTIDLQYIRFFTGDTQENTSPAQGGPRPDKRNYSDEEINSVLTIEGHKVATVASLFETLASEWSAWALVDQEDRIEIDATKVFDAFMKRASEWRGKPDGAGTGATSLVAGVIGLDLQQTATEADFPS